VADLDTTAPSGRLAPATRRVLLPVLAAKALTLLVFAWLALDYPEGFSHTQYIAIYRGNHGVAPDAPPSSDIVFRTWDAEHYLQIARSGYGGPGPHNAYYPLYPALIRAATPLFLGNALLAAIVLSTLLGSIAMLAIHDLVLRRADERVANVTVLLLCAQPAAFFTVLPYSEALFLALFALFFGALERKAWVWAGLLGALLTLTRPIGIFSIVPIGLTLFEARRHSQGVPRWSVGRAGLALALPLLGYGCYFAIMYAQTGDAALGFSIQKNFITAPAINRLLDPLSFLRLIANVTGIHNFTGSLLDRAAFMVFITGALMLARKRDARPMLAMSALLGIVSAVTVSFASFTRYLSVIFPIWLAFAGALAPKSRRGLLFTVCTVLLALQVWLLVRHGSHRWAG
jgi:hypothetical protein